MTLNRRRLTADTGSSTELAIITPLLLLLILIGMQTALWAHARDITRAAASAAAESTRVSGGTTAAGRARAGQVLHRLGHGLIRAPRIKVTRTATTTTVTTTAMAEPIIPGLHLPTAATVTAPVERFTTDHRGFTVPGRSP